MLVHEGSGRPRPLDKSFTDISVFHPQAASYANMSIPYLYRLHETRKKSEYNARVINVEKGTFTPLVFSTTGGMGVEADTFFKRLALKMSYKDNTSYSNIMSFLRRRLRFDLLKTTLISLRGYRGTSHEATNIGDLDIDLLKNAED